MNKQNINKQTTAINISYMFLELAAQDNKLITYTHLQCFLYLAFKYNAKYNDDSLVDSDIVISPDGPLNVTIMQEFSKFKKTDIKIDINVIKDKVSPIGFHQSLILDYIWSKFHKMSVDRMMNEIINDEIFKTQHGTKVTKDNIKSSFNDDGFLSYMDFLIPNEVQ